ncbi:MAG: hypothetical protein ACD_79C00274G0003 [uncultured bacterium]|nr:MAG: hypothetical protein ACD_79C00274G0003 [uncultured bacterium]
MIKLNLLDEAALAQISGGRSSRKPLTKVQKGLVIGGSSFGAIYLIILIYYFIGIKGPLKELSNQMQENQGTLTKLTPIVTEVQNVETELEKLKKISSQFDLFVNQKKNWSQILNILSDEIPDEMIFTSLKIGKGDFEIKKKTKTGLVKEKVPSIILTIGVEVTEDQQSKVSVYIKNLKKHSIFSTLIHEIESGGLQLRGNSYVTNLMLYLKNSLEESVQS